MNDDTLTGRQLGNFKLERIIGRGGMGQVYFGRDVKLNRPVAVKVIDARFRSNPAYAQRFIREAQAVATWRHEHIAQVYYADEQDSLYYFAMEYIDGHDLGQVLSQSAAKGELMPQTDVLRIGQAIASAIDYAHSKDVIHRDVKPSNVIVAHDGRVVLTDFGLALDTQQGSVGEVFGSAHYIAPEQARRSSEAIPQSDVYSLGIMLYEMLTGVVPFDDPSPTSVALLHIMQPPPAPRSLNPKLNSETESVLLKALNKLPQDRYQTGLALMTALNSAFQPSDVPTTPLPPLPVGMKPTQLRPDTGQAIVTESTDPRTRIVGQATAPAKPSGPGAATKRGKPAVWLALGGCSLLTLVTLMGLFMLINPLRSLMQTTIFAQSTATPGTVSTPTATVKITETAQPSGGVTSTQTSAAPATVQYPNGSRFMLFYNDNSFYFLNLSQNMIPINWVAFERLNSAGEALNRYNGSRWAQFYANSTPTWCMALKILDSAPYLDPADCGHKKLYLSLRTPTRDDASIFWTTQDDSQQFRVLWREGGKDEEVARCEISAGKCEVFLP